MAKDKRPSDALRERALTAMLTDAFFTWPSAILIGFSIVAYFLFGNIFPWWRPEYWIAFGVASEAIYLWATITDPVAAQQAVSRMLTEKYDPKDIRNQSARQRLQRALEYKRSIDQFVSQQGDAMKSTLGNTADEINEWIGMIYRLAKAIDTFEDNTIIERDRRAVPTELENLKRRLQIETDPGVRSELEEACRIREQLLSNLKSIENSVKRTDIKLDNTLAQLSTVYAQMQLLDTKAVEGGRAQRLRDDIHEEIQSLQDTISAMNEVYSYEGYKSAVNNLTSETAQSVATGEQDISSSKSQGKSNG